ncbi:MAG: hypothetical protein CMI90_01780 [Pelagibacteraceae bacterium]|nr:hypothetical protein [Pelagibacteraceae bacterium]
MPSILIVDDEIEICKQVSIILKDEGYNSSYVINSDECISELENNNYDLLLVDLWLKNSKLQGNELIGYISNKYSNIIIISFSGHANIDNAIDSVKSGANDFIEKPFETKKLLHIIEKNLEILKNKLTLNNYRTKISFHTKVNYIGSSNEINSYLEKINKLKNRENILINGPNGIGKFYLANKIHNKISNNNFDTFLNLSEILLTFDDILKFNSIHKYFTIYINDIDKYDGLNIKDLNKFILENKINASIIADCVNNINTSTFDFFKIHFKLKSLSSRSNEIIDIFAHYLNLFSQKLLKKTFLLDDKTIHTLTSYDWPGNVFEIMNIAENIVKKIDPTKSIILNEDLSPFINVNNSNKKLYNLNYKDAKDTFERDFLINNLKLNNWNVTLTAKNLKIDRVSLYRKIKTLKINLT